MLKIVVDTSSMISLLSGLNAGYSKSFFRDLINKEAFQVYYSKETFAELLLTLTYPKIKSIIDTKKAARIIAILKYNVEFVKTTKTVYFERDPKDAKFLELIQEVNADYLITKDNDLLDLEYFSDTKIITFDQFKEEWRD